MSTCQCALCKRTAEFNARTKNLSADALTLIQELQDLLDDAEMTRDYYRALAEGSWPDSDAVIASIRKKFQEKQASTTAPSLC